MINFMYTNMQQKFKVKCIMRKQKYIIVFMKISNIIFQLN